MCQHPSPARPTSSIRLGCFLLLSGDCWIVAGRGVGSTVEVRVSGRFASLSPISQPSALGEAELLSRTRMF